MQTYFQHIAHTTYELVCTVHSENFVMALFSRNFAKPSRNVKITQLFTDGKSWSGHAFYVTNMYCNTICENEIITNFFEFSVFVLQEYSVYNSYVGCKTRTDADLDERNASRIMITTYSKTCVKQPLSKRPKIGFQERLSLKAGQKYCRVLQGSILQYF